MAVSEYLNRRLLGATLLGSPFTEVQTVYATLISSLSSYGLTFTEISGPGYARQVTVLGSPTGTKYTNINTVDFGTATGTWGLLSHLGMCDSVSSGNLLFYERLPYPRTVVTSTVVRALPGQVSVSFLPLS